jgi:hypothetical protein
MAMAARTVTKIPRMENGAKTAIFFRRQSGNNARTVISKRHDSRPSGNPTVSESDWNVSDRIMEHPIQPRAG